MTSEEQPDPTPAPAPGRWSALLLTIGVHLALIAFLFFGINWRHEPVTPVQVDLYAAAPPQAPKEVKQPVVQPPKETPKPEAPPREKEPEPQPVPKTPPKPVEEKTEQPDPEIAIREEKKKQEEEIKRKQAEKERQEKEAKEREAKEKEAKEKEAREKEIARQQAEEKARKEEQRKQEEARKIAEQKEKEKQKREVAAQQKINDYNDYAKSRLVNEMLKPAPNAGQTGNDIRDPGYEGRIQAKVRGNLTVPPGISGNPQAVFIVKQLPDGYITSVTLKRSSGIDVLDRAIENAIRKSNPLPIPVDGKPPAELELTFRPLE